MQNHDNLRPEICSFFKDMLDSGLTLRVRVTGRSMAPFLKGNEILTIRKVAVTSLKIGDLILFKDRSGSPVLHRIVLKQRIGNDQFSFRTKGDALLAPDDAVNSSEVIGKVCKIEQYLADKGMYRIDMEFSRWRIINYLTALTGFGKSKFYSAGSKCLSLPFVRTAIKKIAPIPSLFKRGVF